MGKKSLIQNANVYIKEAIVLWSIICIYKKK